MSTLDWLVMSAYSLVIIAIGVWSRRRIHDTADFFTAGGKLPWWLSGISHHMSGYSASFFVAVAAVAYSEGFSTYIWTALAVGVAVLIGSLLFAPRWARLRMRFGVQSPLEYLAIRYNVPTQQILAYSGGLLKIVDVGAKWAATAILLYVFAGIPLEWGVLVTGAVTLVYCTIGGIWADVLNDAAQFAIQLVAGTVMLVAVLMHLDGFSTLWTMWERLPDSHSKPFSEQYTVTFVVAYTIVQTLSYSGGTWNLAQRFISAPDGTSARRSGIFSAVLYVTWPLILLIPMFAAPLLLPDLGNPEHSYAQLALTLLPPGLVGLVLAGLFAQTMSVTGSDANTVAAVVTRDVLPVVFRRSREFTSKGQLVTGRVVTFAFIALSMAIAISAESLGGVLGIIVLWFSALIGPIAIPMLFGLLPLFRRCGPSAALAGWAAGLVTFGLNRYVLGDWVASLNPNLTTTITVAGPIAVSFVVFVLVGFLRPWRDAESAALVSSLGSDPGEERREEPVPAA
ncbi:sodium:solute symporter family protein [Saccharomonospora sp. NPDC006951]